MPLSGWWCCVLSILFRLVILVLFYLVGGILTFSPSRCRIALPVAWLLRDFGGFIGFGRVFWSWEGGNVGVVPGTACGGVQNRAPGTESPSRDSFTLLI